MSGRLSHYYAAQYHLCLVCQVLILAAGYLSMLASLPKFLFVKFVTAVLAVRSFGVACLSFLGQLALGVFVSKSCRGAFTRGRALELSLRSLASSKFVGRNSRQGSSHEMWLLVVKPACILRGSISGVGLLGLLSGALQCTIVNAVHLSCHLC